MATGSGGASGGTSGAAGGTGGGAGVGGSPAAIEVVTSSQNAYLVLDTVGKSLDNWPQNALLTVDRSTQKL